MARPRLYADADAFGERVALYFRCRAQDGEQPTIRGLCAFLGFRDRHALSEQAKRGEAFRRIYLRARLVMEADLSERLIDPARYRPAFVLQLRNNYGWRA